MKILVFILAVLILVAACTKSAPKPEVKQAKYYRVKVVDIDGKVNYSYIITVKQF